MGTPASALGAAGGAASGAAGLITAIGSLLPTTQTGNFHNTGTASSDTLNQQLQLDSSNTTGTEKSKGTKGTKSNTSSSGTESNTSSQVSNAIQQGIQQFSGAQNITTEQTQLSTDAVMRVVNLMLQGNGSVPGLQETVLGERNAGIFNSSTTQLLVDNLLANVGGEVARLSAPKVTSENLGASSTTTDNTTKTVSDTIANIVSNLNQAATGSENTTNQTDLTQQVLNALVGLGSQQTDQENESQGTSKTKTKKKLFGIF